MELNKIEQKIINLLNSEDSRDLAMSLIISTLEYQRGIKLLEYYRPLNPSEVWNMGSTYLLNKYFNITEHRNKKLGVFCREFKSTICFVRWDYLKLYSGYRTYLHTLSSWQELEELIKPYQTQ